MCGEGVGQCRAVSLRRMVLVVAGVDGAWWLVWLLVHPLLPGPGPSYVGVGAAAQLQLPQPEPRQSGVAELGCGWDSLGGMDVGPSVRPDRTHRIHPTLLGAAQLLAQASVNKACPPLRRGGATPAAGVVGGGRIRARCYAVAKSRTGRLQGRQMWRPSFAPTDWQRWLRRR